MSVIHNFPASELPEALRRDLPDTAIVSVSVVRTDLSDLPLPDHIANRLFDETEDDRAYVFETKAEFEAVLKKPTSPNKTSSGT